MTTAPSILPGCLPRWKALRILRHFFHGLNSGQAKPKGQASTPLTLGYNLYSIAYQFYKKKYDLGKYADSSIFINFFERFLQTNLEPKNAPTRFQYYRDRIKYFFKSSPKNNQTDPLLSLIINETTKAPQKSPDRPGMQWFQILNDISTNILKQFHGHFGQALEGANFIDLINSITSSGIIYLGLTPYLAAFSSFSRDRSLGAGDHSHILQTRHQAQHADLNDRQLNMAHFTDTFYEVNGVGLTLRRQVEAAVKRQQEIYHHHLRYRGSAAAARDSQFRPHRGLPFAGIPGAETVPSAFSGDPQLLL